MQLTSDSPQFSMPKIAARVPVVDGDDAAWREILVREGIELYAAAQRAHGDVVEVRHGANSWVQISHPDDLANVFKRSHREFDKGAGWDNFRALVGEGLITVEPHRWLQTRRALQPAFLRRYHERFASQVSQSVAEMLPAWREKAARGETVFVLTEMSYLTMRNAGLTLFGADWRDQLPQLSACLLRVLQYLDNWHFYPKYKRVIGPYFRRTVHARFRRDLRVLENEVQRLVETRQKLRSRGEEPDDLLAQLFHVLEESPTRFKRRQRARFLRDNILTFIFTGHETTAVCIAWTWHLLGQHREVEKKLHDELDRVLEGRAPTRDDLPQLPYLRAVVMESLRLYPPVWVFLRQTTQAENIGGFDLPIGTYLNILPYVVHRHPDFWPQPECFDPERFLAPQNTLHDFAYIPFGGGPRICMGKQTALTEAQLVVAGLAQHFRFRAIEGVEIRPQAGITLVPSHQLPMTLEARR